MTGTRVTAGREGVAGSETTEELVSQGNEHTGRK